MGSTGMGATSRSACPSNVSTSFPHSIALSTITNDGAKMTQKTTSSNGTESNQIVQMVPHDTFGFGRLDQGNGKDVSLDECSREQLEKEACTIFVEMLPVLTPVPFRG